MNNGFFIKNKIINSLKNFEGYNLIEDCNSVFIIALSGGLMKVIPGLSGTAVGAAAAGTGLTALAASAAIVVGAIGLIIGVVAALKAAWENFTPEGKMAKAKREAEEAKKSYDEATSAVNEFKSTYDDWSGLYAKTKELTEGTQEYIEAMGEANQRAMELIVIFKLIMIVMLNNYAQNKIKSILNLQEQKQMKIMLIQIIK